MTWTSFIKPEVVNIMTLGDNLTRFSWNISEDVAKRINESEETSLERLIIVASVLCVIDVCAALGNILVVLSVFTCKRLRTITNYYVVSLALADLMVATMVMPLAIVVELTGRWYFGKIICEIWVSFDVMLCTASILNLCCISLDRYFAITKPLEYTTKRSKRLALAMIAVVWVAAVVITCPPIFGWKEEGRWKDDSSCHLTKDPGYVIYSSLGSFYLPLLVMVFVYMKIFRVASQREKRLKPFRRSFKTHHGVDSNGVITLENIRLKESKESEDDANSTTECYPHNATIATSRRGGHCVTIKRLDDGMIINVAAAKRAQHASGENGSDVTDTLTGRRKKKRHAHSPQLSSTSLDHFCSREDKRKERTLMIREHKAAKTLAIVVGGFVVCWLPFFLMYIIEPFCESCVIDAHMASFFTWLGYFNSLLNPAIYALYNRDFRHSFWVLTFGRECRKTEISV